MNESYSAENLAVYVGGLLVGMAARGALPVLILCSAFGFAVGMTIWFALDGAEETT